MEPLDIMALGASLCVIVSPVVLGLTGAFKKAFPKVEPMAFSVPAGAAFTALAWFATQAIPAGIAGWCAFALVLVVGGLLPSGLFDAGVNLGRKAAKAAKAAQADE